VRLCAGRVERLRRLLEAMSPGEPAAAVAEVERVLRQVLKEQRYVGAAFDQAIGMYR
jgi:hypothetical protein